MAQRCDICGKGPVYGCNVSHSHKKTNRRWLPNVRKMRVKDGDSVKTVTICTKCIKAGKVVPAV